MMKKTMALMMFAVLSVSAFAAQAKTVEIEGMNSLKQAAAGVSQLVTNLDTSVLPATQNALEAAQAALGGVRDVTSPNSPIRYNFEETLKELSAAARSLRDLADFLEQNPNALILGKPGRREEE